MKLLDVNGQGTWSVCATDLDRERILSHDADRICYSASLMKIPVAVGVARRIDDRSMSLTERIAARTTFASQVPGADDFVVEPEARDGWLSTVPPERVDVEALLRRMLTISSNDATNLLMDHIDIDEINQIYSDASCERSVVGRKLYDAAAEASGASNRTTAADTCLIFAELASGRLCSRAMTRFVVGLMIQQQFVSGLPRGLPTDAICGGKGGLTSAVHHDAAVVWPARHRPYVVAVLTEGAGSEASVDDRMAQIAADVDRTVCGRELWS